MSESAILRTLRRVLGRMVKGDGPLADPAMKRAFVDETTGLLTRFVAIEELRVARKARTRGTLVMLDIDLFKLLNSQHGHSSCDELLRVCADRLRERLGASALIARYGGDEFIALLPGLQGENAAAIVDSVLAKLREPMMIPTASRTELVTVKLTVSAGTANFSGQSVDDVLRQADIALYAAKARGRDRQVSFGNDMRQMVTARRDLASTVIALQARNDELHTEARTDALTGLRNRLALDEILNQVIGFAGTRLEHAAVAFIDIDHFGDFNHLHGDAAGDDALRSVANAIRECSRAEDTVFRKGGEEIAVLMTGVHRDNVAAAAERFRLSVQKLGIRHAGSRTSSVLTVTVGVATGVAGNTVRTLLHEAGERAMAAKVTNRRNQVHMGCIATSSTEIGG